ncbi:MAG: hypothetical protein RQ833_06200 [Sphingomonadaceae bacterium]|nr:hypothetical protein [Sphingomonadaceae bacterium]
MRGALLLLIFARPHLTARVWEAVRVARPPRLYVGADGPRPDHPGDAAACAAARGCVAPDWPCEVRTLYRDRNLGCARAVSEAVTWFFQHEQQGIVLEDDMAPMPGFFPFVEALLDRYAADERVGLVAGANFAGAPPGWRASYLFSAHPHIWGWGSWARAWAGYDLTMRSWPAERGSRLIESMTGDRPRAARHFRRLFDRAHADPDSGWDAQLCFHLWRRGQLTVLPRHTLVTNIGFGETLSAHGTAAMPAFQRRAVPRELPLLLTQADPAEGTPHDAVIERVSLGLTARGEVRRALRPVALPLLRAVGLR